MLFFFFNFRGICLDNGTCECPPLYTGESCGTFIGCPSNFDAKICNDLIVSNRMSTLNFTNKETNFKPPFNGNSGENVQVGMPNDDEGDDKSEDGQINIDTDTKTNSHKPSGNSGTKRKFESRRVILVVFLNLLVFFLN
jgi:hypothetical protein